ncbi:deoxyribodipyrimidine photo-lyase [Paracoccus stylophorae]|uniref:Deoxyribodipyrimidine photo-lyase n=1 Tax=Paracoccus stylophorae TaxID=659350 RepID=A0ABY7SXI4_9RHOB|nr:deoxyribodipyrimidine photo-lyase [Paracoccus stylophorae]WCR10657.1 deoxyribodipyrimidine photo-lyase [Paracoccus stylophorae]
MVQICWFRRVLRLDDHPALVAAARAGPVIPLVILDPAEARDHPASAQRQAMSLPHLQTALHRHNSRLIVRRGDPAEVLERIARQTGAKGVHGTEGFPFASDHGLKAAVERGGATLHLHPLADLVPRACVRTQQGGVYQVFTPFWRALRGVDIPPPLDPPRLTLPQSWPDSDGPDWPEARAAMDRGWDVVAEHIAAGEDAARDRLDQFLHGPVTDYASHRDQPWRGSATSGLSDALAVGEISARRIWHTGLATREDGTPGADDFLREVAWREFARELFHESPDMGERCWREGWNDFPWRRDNADARDWRRARTGVPMVDAGLRELFVTGRMHNRVRMIAGSYLTKHLLTDWRVGLDWFARTLIDWDAASNAMNWQWVAGCGPDASPYFRVFNPELQAKKFDGDARYRDHWLKPDSPGACAFAQAAPRSWNVDLVRRPLPALSLSRGRAQALTAYEDFKE